MKNNNYKLGLYEKSMPSTLLIHEKLSETKIGGFDFLELSVDETEEKIARLDWGTDVISEITFFQLKLGVPIESICLSAHRSYPLGHPDKKTRLKSLEIMEKAIALASKIGARVIQLAGYDVYYEKSSLETNEFFGESLAIAVQMAAKEGVTLAFETMETPFMDTIEKAMYWVNYINSPYLHIYPDIGNLTNAAIVHGHKLSDDFKMGNGHIFAVHLKETKPGIYREVPFGNGHVRFDEAITELWRQGVRRFVGEFWYDGSENWRSIIEQNNAFIRNKISIAMKNFNGNE